MRYIIHVYEQNYTHSEKLYLPEELTPKDKCQFIEAYIDSDYPNLNHIETISLMQPSKDFPISDALRLKAKRKNQDLSKKVFENGAFFSYGTELSFSPEQKEEKKAEIVGRKFSVSYSTVWLCDTLDYPSILNNFIHIFEFVDFPQMRCLHVAKESESGILERTMQSKSSRIYPVNHAFQFAEGLTQMQMHAYYGFLSQNSIRYENVLEWFFTKYLQEEFGCSEMRASFPSEGTTYCEKCITLCSLLDSVLKQFSLYVDNGDIDFELLSMIQGSKKFGDIKIYTYICRKNETMPTLLRIFGLRFFFYLDEHLPIHVHVECGGKLAKIEIEQDVRVVYNHGLKEQELRTAVDTCIIYRENFIAEWHKRFG